METIKRDSNGRFTKGNNSGQRFQENNTLWDNERAINSRFKKGESPFEKFNIKPPQGAEHWNWQGGKTDTNMKVRRSSEYKLWVSQIFERDDYTCQSCGERGKKLCAHHIVNFSNNENKRLFLQNGVTLCKNCHISFHKQFGFKNNNGAQFKVFVGMVLA